MRSVRARSEACEPRGTASRQADVVGAFRSSAFLEVNREVERVGVVEGVDAPDGLRPETHTRTVSRAHVEWRADDRYFVAADRPDVRLVRRLEEGVDAGIGRLRSPDEC